MTRMTPPSEPTRRSAIDGFVTTFVLEPAAHSSSGRWTCRAVARSGPMRFACVFSPAPTLLSRHFAVRIHLALEPIQRCMPGRCKCAGPVCLLRAVEFAASVAYCGCWASPRSPTTTPVPATAVTSSPQKTECGRHRDRTRVPARRPHHKGTDMPLSGCHLRHSAATRPRRRSG